MTISTTPSEKSYQGDNVSTSFPIPFVFGTASDIKVIRTDPDGNITQLTTGWSVSGGNGSTGTLTLSTPLPSGHTLTIIDDPERSQTTSYVSNDAFPAAVQEFGLDKLTRLVKRLHQRIERTVRTLDGDPASGSSMVFPTVAARRGKFAFWSDDTTARLEPAVGLPVGTPLSQSVIGELANPQTEEESSAGLVANDIDTRFSSEYIRVKRYGALGDGTTDDTTAVRNAFKVAREFGGAQIVFEHGDFLLDTIVFDFERGAIIGDGAILRAKSTIPDGGGILVSLSGDSTSGAANQAILDGIYGAGVVPVRSAVPNYLEHVRIRGLRFASNNNKVLGIWATGFTRGCVIEQNFFDAFEHSCIALSGSWSFALKSNFCNGRNNGGRLIDLGTAANGAYAGSPVCNAIDVTGNWCGRGAQGFHWDRGQGGNVNGNTFEHNLTNVVLVNPRAFSFCGNYMEGETSANMLIGAENGLEFVGDAVISGNQIATSTGIAIQLNAIHNSIIGPNRMSGAVSQQYFILTATPSTQITGNFIEIEQLSSTYVNNTTKLDIALNRDIYERALYRHNFSAVARRARIIKNEDYTFTAADAGASVHHSSGSAHAWTIPAGGASIPNGAKIRCTNGGSGVVTLTRDTGVTLNLYTGSGVSNQNVAMAQGSWADLEKVSANTWDCIGQGLS